MQRLKGCLPRSGFLFLGGLGGATVAAAGGELEAGEGGGGRGRGWDGMSAHGGETSASSAL